MRRTPWLLATALLAAVAAGCGGSSTKSAESGATATGATTATVATTQSAVTTESAPTVPAFATSKNCTRLLELGETFGKALEANSAGSEPQLAAAAKAFRAMADAAPSEIRDDFRTLADAFRVYVQAWSDAGIAPGTTPTPAQITAVLKAAQSIGTPDVQAAQAHVSSWAAANCGVSTQGK